MRIEIMGRRKEEAARYGTEGCAYMGRMVTYPGGRYEETGPLYLDLATPHCMLVLGKRGTGKSYTLGVLLEGFSTLPEEMRDRLAVVVVDTMSVFHSLKSPNTHPGEVEAMKRFGDLRPEGMDNIIITMPRRSVELLGEGVHYDRILEFRADSVPVNGWLSLFNLEPTHPVGSLLLDLLSTMEMPYTIEDMAAAAGKMDAREEDRRALRALIRMAGDTGLFSPEARGLVEPGKINVLDISGLRRMGSLDLRAFVVALLAEGMLHRKTVETTLEMQRQAGLSGTRSHGSGSGGGGGSDTVPDAVAEDRGPPEGESIGPVYLVIDEAHLFLPSDGRTTATTPLIDWIKLGRHPGLSIILATQEPSA
ncbi:MAG: ATP-binding protein, partial [Thermoplasmata archaeon]|nr:ATP-binding protein [Thermoplasmata archaeon]